MPFAWLKAYCAFAGVVAGSANVRDVTIRNSLSDAPALRRRRRLAFAKVFFDPANRRVETRILIGRASFVEPEIHGSFTQFPGVVEISLANAVLNELGDRPLWCHRIKAEVGGVFVGLVLRENLYRESLELFLGAHVRRKLRQIHAVNATSLWIAAPAGARSLREVQRLRGDETLIVEHGSFEPRTVGIGVKQVDSSPRL